MFYHLYGLALLCFLCHMYHLRLYIFKYSDLLLSSILMSLAIMIPSFVTILRICCLTFESILVFYHQDEIGRKHLLASFYFYSFSDTIFAYIS